MDTNDLRKALSCGNIDEIKSLIDSGADIYYRRPHGYDILIDAVHCSDDVNLIPILELLIARGVNLDGVSDYSESALNVLSRRGIWDAIKVLLDAGSNPSPLQWNNFMHSIALGSLADVESHLARGADLSAKDFWSRTPWLLSLQVGDISKSKAILAAGARLSDRGRCGKPPLSYPVINAKTEMLSWLLTLGLNPDDTDQFGGTALQEAVELGATDCVRILVNNGADVHHAKYKKPLINSAPNKNVVRLLIDHGEDLNDINDEMRRVLAKLPIDGAIEASREDYLIAKSRRFGVRNPEIINYRFWRSMITSGKGAYAARELFADSSDSNEPVWCFQRFGQSITELPDGRIIEIAGEHEDYYDPDFCIYNDVVCHRGDGTFVLYGYPKEVFPPTDFHTATLVENFIYIIGTVGYPADRVYGETPVYRLNIHSFGMERLETTGDKPGWISRHKAALQPDGNIRISGGKTCLSAGEKELYEDSPGSYLLDLKSRTWIKVA